MDSFLCVLEQVGLHPRQAQRWMRVARSPRFATPESHLLPACISTLGLISRIPEDDFGRLLESGQINAATTRREVEAILCSLKRDADEHRILNLEPRPGKFRTLLIDPGWTSEGGRDCPYATMTQEQLLDLPIPQWLEDNGHVYLCCTSAEICNGNAVALFKRWCIQDPELLVWNKTWKNGRPALGMGQNFRHTFEVVLFGVRGKLRTRVVLPTGFAAPVTKPHSTKPPALYEIVRTASYPPYGEVFQRQPRDGFVNLFPRRDAEHKSGRTLELQGGLRTAKRSDAMELNVSAASPR